MQARSALFDLYGDHLRSRGGRAPVAALVRLLAPLGLAAPAVRTAISRMVRQGWLLPVRLPGGAGYQLSVRAVHRLDEAAARIYRTGRPSWDGAFDVVVLTPSEVRAERDKLTATLAYLGYGRLNGSTWVAPRPADELDTVLKEAGVGHERFSAKHSGTAGGVAGRGATGAAAMVRRAWDLDAIADAYRRFVSEQKSALAALGREPSDERAYAARFRLVHAWRTFLFRDPQLPPALLPDPWPGDEAAAYFDRNEASLRPAADRFVEGILAST